LSSFDESLNYLQKYLEHESNNCDAYNLLGIILIEKSMLDEAIVNFNKCISLQMNFVKAYNNLGIVFYKKKEFEKSIYFLKSGINIDPDYSILYFNLAKSYSDSQQYISALDTIKIFLDKEPNNPAALALIGYYLIRIGKISEGLKFLEKSLSISPDVKENYNLMIFNMNYLEDIYFEQYHNIINKLKNLFKKYSEKNIKHEKKIINLEKIKIGFISGDFNDHAVAHQLLDVLNYFSQEKNFDLHAYCNSEKEDLITKKIKSYFKNWNVVYDFNDSRLVEIIKSDNIDILVDLSGHSKGNRLEVFFSKPAPIQVTWAGYLASTGLKEIDYIIADKNSITQKEEQQFTEKIYRLKNTWTVLKQEIDIPLNKEIPFIRNKYVTFGSFNNIRKINNTVIEVWSKILCNVQDSKLILFSSNFEEEDFKRYFIKLFVNYGVKNNQLNFEGSRQRNDLLNKYNSIDITLDTFPYNGGTTSLESLWMCVPVLTKRGNSFLSKCSESININIGLEDWVCSDNVDYINKATEMSKNIDKLQLVRSYLMNNRKNFKIFDSKIFADDLSAAFKNMVVIYNNA
jgi:predicted O-linked N-acetylglucosamine transferase (SPINDLY family)